MAHMNMVMVNTIITKSSSTLCDSILENAIFQSSKGYFDSLIQQIKEVAYEEVLQVIRNAGGVKANATFRIEGYP